MATPQKIQARRAFLERYGNGPRSYFRREGALVMIVLTVLIIAAGAFALANVTLSIGYLFLLLIISLTIAGIGTYFVSVASDMTTLMASTLQARRHIADPTLLFDLSAHAHDNKTYHYKVTQARRTMATVSELETGYNDPFNRHLDHAWGGSVYVPPPPAAVVSNRPVAS
ncbi:hypothetical protein BGZ70_009871 [Mortierella alpina]|uniref:Uncharacterized protein n=1 Tax=Mortierella alpina TaxID=64518 RepID=A0A9P6J0F5_MORAP|nr:hypothetical protein BGZ70_009871 [Mortierella alpina]